MNGIHSTLPLGLSNRTGPPHLNRLHRAGFDCCDPLLFGYVDVRNCAQRLTFRTDLAGGAILCHYDGAGPDRQQFRANGLVQHVERAAVGRLVESAVGAPLVNTTTGTQVLVLYWRERNQEVDFVMHRGGTVAALAVKSGRRRELPSGIEAFPQAFSLRRKLLVGGQGMSLEEFLMTPATEWV